MVTIAPGLQVGLLMVLGGPISAGLNGAVAIAPAVATAPVATAPAAPAAPATTVPGVAACFDIFFFPAANAGEAEIAATMAQQTMVFILIGIPSGKQLLTKSPALGSAALSLNP
jgi:hypothetical protein